MSDSSKAVFLSYASQDAEVAKRICDALRAAGVEVWFDQSELRGGDAWDALIRKRIKECALFVPVITPSTQARAEGYFRLEWKLAVDRSHLMADDAAFLFPVVIGDVSDATARVPDKFRDVQWTRLRLDETPAELGARVAKLLSTEPGAGSAEPGAPARAGRTPIKAQPNWLRYAWAGVGILFALVYAVRPLLQEARRPDPKPPASAVVPVAPVEKPAVPIVSEARQLALRARAMSFDKYDSTSDDFSAAEGMLKHALELDPNDAEIWAASSQLNKQFLTRGFDRSTARATVTLTQAQRAVKLDPDSIEAQFALGYAERGTDPAAAEKIMRWILARRPDHPGALFAMSNLTFRQGKVDESLGYLQEAAKQPKWAALAGYLKYLTYFSRARFAEADQAIRQSIAVQPSANSVAGLAMVLLAWKGDAEAAARVFAEAPTTMRNEPRTVWMTAQVQLCRRAPDEALNALDRLQDDYIQDSWFAAPKAYYIGRAQALAGRPEAARVAWEAGLAIMQDRLKGALTNPGLHLVKGELLALLGRDDEALREARTVAELSRGEKLPWFASPVRIYAELGRVDEALPLLAGLCPPKASDDVGWPLTPALLRLDPLWDKIRDDPRFQKLATSDQATTSLAPAMKPDDKSVAVLAFANLSDDKANEYFSDGISEELLTVLQKIPGLHVAARTSAFYFKGRNATAQEIGEKLGVATLVEGSVRKAGNSVRITARLSRAATGEQLWSESYTRDLKDVFAVQSELAQTIVGQLRGQLGGAAQVEIEAQVQAAERGGTLNPEAHELYLQGKYFLGRATLEGSVRATTLLQRAVDLDPSFALAWAALSGAGTFRGGYGNNLQDFEEGFALARRAADRAIGLEPALAAGQIARLDVQSSVDFDWQGSRESLRRAQALAPNDPAVVFRAAQLAYTFGEVERATELIRQAVALDPVNPSVYVTQGYVFMAAHRFAEAEAAFRHIVDISPGAPWGHAGVGMALVARGQCDLAVTEAEQEGPLYSRLYTLGLARWGQKNHVKADEVLAELIKKDADVAAYQIATVYAYRGEPDRAFEWLERAYRQHDPGLSWGKLDFFLQPLHADPRWPAFLHKLGLADDQLK